MQTQTFEFYKYIQPIWYFHLIPNIQSPFPACFLDDKSAGILIRESGLEKDRNYQSELSQNADLAFRAWNMGYWIETDREAILNSRKNRISVYDNYYFIARYFKKIWLLYILILRILSLKNPIRELYACIRVIKTKRIGISRNSPGNEKYHQHHVNRDQGQRVSVILPTLNRYPYLKDAIKDIENQSIRPLELIIIDQSDVPDPSFYQQFTLPLRIFYSGEKGQWLARNLAIQEARGDLLLFFDDDSRVEPDWIGHHLRCLTFFEADISAGVSLSKTGAKIPENYALFRWADQFDSGNALVKREVFEKVGMFDRQFDKMRMGDGEFGLRAYLAGFVSISNPYASRIHLKVSGGGLRQLGSWDAFRPTGFFKPRPIPSVLYYFRKYFPRKCVRLALFQQIMFSLSPYRKKGSTFYNIMSVLLSLLLFPCILYQVQLSLRIAKKMLRDGDRIEWIRN
jgi:glycosyltransferase involved in cell wall biosynthesis